MKKRVIAALILAAAAIGPASAQQASPNVPTETQDRGRSGNDNLMWNLLGLLGLIGLTGMWRPSDNDGYTNDPI